MPSDLHQRASLPSKLLIARFTQIPFGLAEWISNGFWHIVSIVKERDPPVQQKGLQTTYGEYGKAAKLSTADYRAFLCFPQGPQAQPKGGYIGSRATLPEDPDDSTLRPPKKKAGSNCAPRLVELSWRRPGLEGDLQAPFDYAR